MTTEVQNDYRTALEVLAALTETPVYVKDILQDFMLLTYDLPNTDEGNRARARFLQQAAALGAMQHTESVYLLPWSSKANVEALELSQAGKLFIWSSQILDPAQARLVTEAYDRRLLEHIDEQETRAAKIYANAITGKKKLAQNMLEKTWPVFNSLSAAVVARGNEQLAQKMSGVLRLLKECEARLG